MAKTSINEFEKDLHLSHFTHRSMQADKFDLTVKYSPMQDMFGLSNLWNQLDINKPADINTIHANHLK